MRIRITLLCGQDKQEATVDEVEAAIKAVNDRLGILPSVEKGIKFIMYMITFSTVWNALV